MKSLLRHHVNDVVSLTILALMAVALIAGQTDARVHRAVSLHEISGVADFAIDIEAAEALRELIEIRLDSDIRSP